MRRRLVTVPLSIPCLRGNEWRYVKRALDSGWVSSAGPHVTRFEERVAAFVGVPHAVATANGTSAIHAALLALGVGKGDRVAVPTLSFIASVNPVRYCGAEPIFIDSEPDTGNMDPRDLARELERCAKRGRPPKAVVVVHLFGHPCDMGAILRVTRRHGIPVVEDAAQSLGATYKGRSTGSWGRLACLSFNGNKMVTAGSGGMVLTRSKALASRVRYLTTQARDHALEYRHDEIGYNYRMDSLSAALGLAQLEQLGSFLKIKRAQARRYRDRLRGVRGVRVLREREDCRSNYWLMSLLLDRDICLRVKPRMIAELRRAGIESRPFFMPIHSQRPYRKGRRLFPVAEELYARGLNLPNHVRMRAGDIDRIAKIVARVLR